jgi:hypothetical protein
MKTKYYVQLQLMPSISPEMTATPVTRRQSDPKHAYLFAAAGIEAGSLEASYHGMSTIARLPSIDLVLRCGKYSLVPSSWPRRIGEPSFLLLEHSAVFYDGRKLTRSIAQHYFATWAWSPDPD